MLSPALLYNNISNRPRFRREHQDRRRVTSRTLSPGPRRITLRTLALSPAAYRFYERGRQVQRRITFFRLLQARNSLAPFLLFPQRLEDHSSLCAWRRLPSRLHRRRLVAFCLAGAVARLRLNGADSKPSRFTRMISEQAKRCSPAEGFRWSHYLKSALLPASWPSTTATTSPYPLIGRAERSRLPPGCNSTARGTNLSRWWGYRMDVRPRHCQLTELGSSRWDSRKQGSQGTPKP